MDNFYGLYGLLSLRYVIETIYLFWFLDWYIFAMLPWYVFAYLPWNFFGYFDWYLMAISFGHFDTMFLRNLFWHIMTNFFGNLETIRVIYYGVSTTKPLKDRYFQFFYILLRRLKVVILSFSDNLSYW